MSHSYRYLRGQESIWIAFLGKVGIFLVATTFIHCSATSPPIQEDQVKATVVPRTSAVQSCFDANLNSDPHQELNFTLSMRVSDKGRVETVTISKKSFVMDPLTERCLTAEAKTWIFPVPADERPTTITHSFSFPPFVVAEGLKAQEILAVIRSNLSQIHHCYDKLQKRAPGATGKVGMTLIIGASGSVNSAVIKESTITDKLMQKCVLDRVAAWKFPKPKGGKTVTVNYPFVFNQK